MHAEIHISHNNTCACKYNDAELCDDTRLPNGNAAADAMISVIAHELAEAATDPLLNAWFDSAGYENADKCAWDFGLYSGNANVVIGTKDTSAKNPCTPP